MQQAAGKTTQIVAKYSSRSALNGQIEVQDKKFTEHSTILPGQIVEYAGSRTSIAYDCRHWQKTASGKAPFLTAFGLSLGLLAGRAWKRPAISRGRGGFEHIPFARTKGILSNFKSTIEKIAKPCQLHTSWKSALIPRKGHMFKSERLRQREVD